MAAYYLESSAVAKLYMWEVGSAWVTGLFDPVLRHELFVARITAAEVAAALCRRIAGGFVLATEAARGIASLRHDLASTYQVVEIEPVVIDLALDLAPRHGLRGYDAVQLAAALLTQRALSAASLMPLMLVSAGSELNAAAQAEGLAVENPNSHR